MNRPKFYDWNGHPTEKDVVWTFGWLTGRDNDLICIKPNMKTV